MYKRNSKILAAMLTIVLVFSIFPSLRVNADASGTCGDNLTWTYVDSTQTLTISGTGEMTDWSDWSTYAPWYDQKDNIKSIIIGDGITTIGVRAFRDLPNLESVTLPDSVTVIGDRSFTLCSNLSSINLPNNLTLIDNNAFYNCSSLTSIVFPSNLTTIGEHAFEYCSGLTEIDIPDSVTTLGYQAFAQCTSLKSATLSNQLTELPGTFWGCSQLTSVTIPDSVTTLTSTFYECTSLTSITIPDSVTSIGNAFEGCTSLKSVTIDSVTSIGTHAFTSCTSLTNITIPDSVTSIGDGAFKDCASLKSVTIGSGVTSIGDEAFKYCTSLTSVTIPNSVTSIGNNVFSGCNKLKTTDNSISIDKALYDKYYKNAFPDIPLTSFNFTEYTITYDTATTNGTVTGATTTSVSGETIIPTVSPNSGYVVKEVTYTNIKNTPVPITPDASGNYSFTMPSCNTTVSATFMLGGNCGANGDNVTWIFDDTTGTLTISGSGKMADYFTSNKAPWYAYRDSILNVVLPDGLETIGSLAFKDCDRITSITIPSSVTSIGNSAFVFCRCLESISIPSSVTSIGEKAFASCYLLTSITIPDKVTSIANNTFNYCTCLTSIYIDKYQYENNKSAYPGIDESLVKYINYAITYTSDGNGTVSGVVESPSTDTITLTITPNANYVIDTVTYTDNGTEKTINKDANGNYSFEMPVGATTVNATFKLADYEIKFINTDGTVLQSGPVTYGNTPTYTGATPTKAADAQYTYTFSGWDPAITTVTGDATYTAVFNKTAITTNTPAVTTTPAPGTYYVQSIEEKDGAIVITIKRTENDDQTYELVQSIETDGKQLSVGDQIELTSGSAIITIKKDFVSTLTPGTHSMKVTFKDGGSITLEYTVKEPEKAAAQAVQATGEATDITTVAGVGMILTACGIVIFAKKRREET